MIEMENRSELPGLSTGVRGLVLQRDNAKKPYDDRKILYLNYGGGGYTYYACDKTVYDHIHTGMNVYITGKT